MSDHFSNKEISEKYKAVISSTKCPNCEGEAISVMVKTLKGSSWNLLKVRQKNRKYGINSGEKYLLEKLKDALPADRLIWHNIDLPRSHPESSLVRENADFELDASGAKRHNSVNRPRGRRRT